MAAGEIRGGPKHHGQDLSVKNKAPDVDVKFTLETLSFDQVKTKFNTIWKNRLEEIWSDETLKKVLVGLINRRSSFFKNLSINKLRNITQVETKVLFDSFIKTRLSEEERQMLKYINITDETSSTQLSVAQLAIFASLILKLIQTKKVSKVI